MKAAVLAAADNPLRYEEFPDPPVNEETGRLTMVAAGLHPVVRAMATGRHYGSADGWPMIPGIDAVARTPDGVLVYAAGAHHPYGTFAELISASLTIPLPEGADPVQVAAGLNPGMASWLPLQQRRAELGEAGLGRVLVLGATGVAGQLAVQNALALGADQVIAAGRNLATLHELAADRCSTVALTGAAEDDTRALSAAVVEHRPSTVLDFVWGAPAEATFAALTRGGLSSDNQPISYLEIGESAGQEAAVPGSLLRSAAITLRGSGAGSSAMSEIFTEIPRFMERIADQTVTVPVAPFPLADAADAWQAITPRRRIVLTGEQRS